MVGSCIFYSVDSGYVFFPRKWSVRPAVYRVDHFVDWGRSEDRPCFHDCVEKSNGKELWLNLFLLDPSGSSRILQPYPNFETDCSLEDLCQTSKTEATDHSSPDLRFCFGIVFVTGTGKSFHLQKDCQHIVGKKLEKYSNMATGWSCFLLPSLPEISNDHDPSWPLFARGWNHKRVYNWWSCDSMFQKPLEISTWYSHKILH